MPTAVTISLIAMSLSIIGWLWLAWRTRSARAEFLAQLHDRLKQIPANQKALAGLGELEQTWKLESADALRDFTASDLRKFRDTIGQLYAPKDELFPILTKPLPLPCLFWLSACPALIHPKSGVIFGFRIGTYLCVLRLPSPIREQALANNAAWLSLPTSKDLDIAKLFGPDWVVPNNALGDLSNLYQAAFDHANQAAS